MNKLIGLSCCLAVLGNTPSLKAQIANQISVPYNSMPTYSDYREELLSERWQPVLNGGISGTGGFPELICGNRICSAEWVHESGQRTIIITVWTTVDEVTDELIYRIAPAID